MKNAQPSTILDRPSDLSPADGNRLDELELVIKKGMATFVGVGNALLEIREQRLYRATHGSFEDYCLEKWGMKRAHAYRLMEAASVAGNLSPIGDRLPATESQARPLASLPAAEQPEAWKEAVQTAPKGKVTAKHVQKVVARRYGKPAVDPSKVKSRSLILSANPEVAASTIIREFSTDFIRGLVQELTKVL